MNGKDYAYVYHEVGEEFKDRMSGWDTSTHPFDVWFRESIMAVYDIESAAIVEEPNCVLDYSV